MGLQRISRHFLNGSRPRTAPAELPQFFAQMTQEDVPLRVPIEEAGELGSELQKQLESHGEEVNKRTDAFQS